MAANDRSGRQKTVVLARGELDKLEGPKYAARRAEAAATKAGEEARPRERQAAPLQDEAEESDATEEEATRERTTRVVAGEGDCTKTREELRRELEIGLRRI